MGGGSGDSTFNPGCKDNPDKGWPSKTQLSYWKPSDVGFAPGNCWWSNSIGSEASSVRAPLSTCVFSATGVWLIWLLGVTQLKSVKLGYVRGAPWLWFWTKIFPPSFETEIGWLYTWGWEGSEFAITLLMYGSEGTCRFAFGSKGTALTQQPTTLGNEDARGWQGTAEFTKPEGTRCWEGSWFAKVLPEFVQYELGSAGGRGLFWDKWDPNLLLDELYTHRLVVVEAPNDPVRLNTGRGEIEWGPRLPTPCLLSLGVKLLHPLVWNLFLGTTYPPGRWFLLGFMIFGRLKLVVGVQARTDIGLQTWFWGTT